MFLAANQSNEQKRYEAGAQKLLGKKWPEGESLGYPGSKTPVPWEWGWWALSTL